MSLTGTSSSDKLICAISGHGQGERLMRRAREAGARGGTLLPGRGTAAGGLLGLLCLGDQEKDILIILGSAEQIREVARVWRATRSESRTAVGISFSLDLEAVLRPQRGFAVDARPLTPAAASMSPRRHDTQSTRNRQRGRRAVLRTDPVPGKGGSAHAGARRQGGSSASGGERGRLPEESGDGNCLQRICGRFLFSWQNLNRLFPCLRLPHPPEFNSAGELRLFRNMAGPLGFPRRKCGELQSISPLKCSTESGRAGLRRRRETACVPEHGVWPADIFRSKMLWGYTGRSLRPKTSGSALQAEDAVPLRFPPRAR